ncbi:Adenylylsulfatase HINT1 [Phytophthora citrophthora]|uniref:Adenylylsulfatase HINT1 n=1 Tax=Phytophthora citrophthora TaxID=4793 RepID=A0AAD9LCL4_9STRA|nr:Adenylylsulfatase HINT1 [Phytophthora citrophthora]
MFIGALRRSFLASGSSLSRRPLASFALRAMSSDERSKADAAAASGASTAVGETIFDKIINGQIPAKIAYEDEQCLAFHDVNPQAPVHILLIPKKRDGLTQLAHSEERHEAVLGHLLYTAKLVAKQQNLDKGFRIVINDGEDGCQSVFHLHLHLLGGRKLGWPPG